MVDVLIIAIPTVAAVGALLYFFMKQNKIVGGKDKKEMMIKNPLTMPGRRIWEDNRVPGGRARIDGVVPQASGMYTLILSNKHVNGYSLDVWPFEIDADKWKMQSLAGDEPYIFCHAQTSSSDPRMMKLVGDSVDSQNKLVKMEADNNLLEASSEVIADKSLENTERLLKAKQDGGQGGFGK